jgi:anti-sigma factor RsiW
MHIDRSNYEIWCIDWLDGRLTGSQAEKVRAFLDQNPDLREEFEEMSGTLPAYPLTPLPGREKLYRTPEQLSPEQFVLLCAAYLENDLDSAGKKELEEMVSSDPERRLVFGQMQKTKLLPGKIIYKRKKSLLKHSVTGRKWRLPAAAISAAAAIVFLLIIFRGIFSGHNTHEVPVPVPVVSENKEEIREKIVTPVPAKKTDEEAVNPDVSHESGKPAAHGRNTKHEIKNAISAPVLPDTKTPGPDVSVVKVAFKPSIGLPVAPVPDSLVAISPEILPPAGTVQPEKTEGFMARVVREKILREKPAENKRLNGYEIAEAGVEGLNKLLGWNMAFNTNNDESGQPKSVSFKSRLLKIQAPVKKNADRQ